MFWSFHPLSLILGCGSQRKAGLLHWVPATGLRPLDEFNQTSVTMWRRASALQWKAVMSQPACKTLRMPCAVLSLVQDIARGYLVGTTAALRGACSMTPFDALQGKLCCWVANIEFQNDSRGRGRQMDYHGTEVPHMHLLLWREQLQHLRVTSFLRRALRLQHSASFPVACVRPFFKSALRVLRRRSDVQRCDKCCAPLRHYVGYVSKSRDAWDSALAWRLATSSYV